MHAKGRSRGTVASLKPGLGITVIETARVFQACQLMASKRQDCVLAVNADGQLSGILTDKDVAFRVVALGLDPRKTLVRDVMTRDPIAVLETGPRNDALGLMVSRGFRHLPVLGADADNDNEDSDSDADEASNIVGVLDITKCVFDKLPDLERKAHELVAHTPCPDLRSVLMAKGDVPLVEFNSPVVEAALLMKEGHETGVLVASGSGDGSLAGILTTKDLVARVVAGGMDPAVTPVSAVMTPNPKSAFPSTNILDALKTLHAGHYLHLPVVDGTTPIGLIDVLTLTISMLNYMLNKDPTPLKPQTLTTFSVTEASGPVWNSFWNSTWSAAGDSESNAGSEIFSENGGGHGDSMSASVRYNPPAFAHGGSGPGGARSARTSVLSAGGGSVGGPQRGAGGLRLSQHMQSPPAFDNGAAGNSGEAKAREFAMMHPAPLSMASTSAYAEDLTRMGVKLVYVDSEEEVADGKSRRSSTNMGKVVRFSIVIGSTTLAEVKATAVARVPSDIGVDANSLKELRLSYEDDDGDWVLLSSDTDLDEAVSMARRLGEKLNMRASFGNSGSLGATASSVDEAEESDVRKTVERKSGQVPRGGDFGGEVPLLLNVAVSAGVFVAAAYIISRLYNR
ncbi:hypothetical protein HDU81_009185 [Chytriomyces hyalinus]|nr:hypothetical protein HDU81_009185 [Chytriomyces hyalinus]